MSGKTVRRKTSKDLLKVWRTIAQNHFKRLQERLAAWKRKYKEMTFAQCC